uniref:Cadherin domain-containing protein n=2 Tax=Plectus sambesii TaxID=2011161 RepID=A0A914V6Y8_9BILA
MGNLSGVNTHRVIINVLNVDEPPAFVNGQKPFLAVVSLNPPKTGLNVFQFVARDENGDGDSDVEYRLINTEPPGMFRIEPSSGIVRTTRTEYELGKTYRVFVQARDRTPQPSDKQQDSEIAVLEVLAGDRPPQFVQQHYTVGVPEDTDVEASVVDVKAHGFKSIDGRSKGPITYSLYTDENSDSLGRVTSDVFSIDGRSGVVHLQQKLDFDDGKKPRLHKLR